MEQGICPLCALKEGEKAVVEQVKGPKSLKLRLQELGLVGGQTVSCLRVAPMGSPAAYSVRGSVIAIRKRDARVVEVRPWV